MKKINLLILFFFSVLIFTSCEDLSTDLEPEYTQDPTPTEVLTENTAKGIIKGWYVTVNNVFDTGKGGPGLALTTMADMNTCSWGNLAMKDLSSEPRVAWNNNTTYGNVDAIQGYFNSIYALLSDSNGLLAKLEAEGPTTYENTPRVEALARFGQAAFTGSIALVFDRVWLTDEFGPLNEGGDPYTPMEALAYCLDKLDKAINIAENNSFTLDSDFINGTSLSSAQFAQFLNTYAARLMVNMPRNSAQAAALDWDRVLAYTQKGLDYDFNITSDGWNTWYSEWVIMSIYPGWLQVDMRVINLMDPNTIDYWVSSNPTLAESTSVDNRLASDFEYLDFNGFKADRGLYHFSNYRLSRYDAQAQDSGWTGTFTEMAQAENELYKAEAMMRTGDIDGAAGVLNLASNARKSRGGLADVAEDADAISDAIHYEISVELQSTGMGLGFFEMRRNDLLQAGTPLHFPIPGAALEAAAIPNYTFGGTTGVAGEDYSNGGWR
jgi:hypothetical protein